MDYYLVCDTPTIKSQWMLGAESFGVFYPDHGWDILNDIPVYNPELIKFIKIYNEQGKVYSIDEFLALFEVVGSGTQFHAEGTLKMRSDT